jgi:hypothetical protein
LISDLRAALEASEADGPTIQLVRRVLSALPAEAQLQGRGGLAGLLAEPATERAIREDLDASSAASDIAAGIDRGELLRAVAVGPRVALSVYDAHLEWAVGIGELEREQVRDASVRLHGIGLIAQRLFAGSTPERAGEMLSFEAGRALLVWFIAVELVLAAHTEDEPVTVQDLRDLLDQHSESVIQDLGHLGSRADREGGQAVIKAMLGVIGPVVQAATGAVPSIAAAVRGGLPELTELGADGLVAEAELLEVYTLLTARLVAEVEAERLEMALPEPPAAQAELDPEWEAAQAALQAAQDRWDSGPLAAARVDLAETQARQAELAERKRANNKLLRAVRRKLSRTIDRRARIAEAPPAGPAEAEAGVELAKRALKAADTEVKRADREIGASQEGVIAARSLLKRRDQTLEERRAEAAQTQAGVESMQAAVAQLQAQDEALLAQVRQAQAQAEANQAQAVLDMKVRSDVAVARQEELRTLIPGTSAAVKQIDVQLQSIRAAFFDLASNRDALADALVLARQAQPEQQAARKDTGAIAAQATIKHERLAARLAEAAAVFATAQRAVAKADSVALGARERRDAAGQAAEQAVREHEIAAQLQADLQAQLRQITEAIAANQAALAAAQAANLAARSEAYHALERALSSAQQRRADLGQRDEGLRGAVVSIAERSAEHERSCKALGMKRATLAAEITLVRAQRAARVALGEAQRERVEAQDSALSINEGEIATWVRASRKAGAAHAGAAARVVGARDALGSVQRQYSQLDRVRSQHVDDVAQNNARIRSLRGRMASMAEDIAAAQASPSVAQGSLSSVEALLAQMTPTVQSAAPAGSPDDDATAMFDPRALRARMVKEQEEEDAADQTVIFSRKPAVLEDSAAEDSAAEDSAAEDSAAEDSAATAIFSVAELRKRVLAEESKEDEPDEAATAIFLRPQKTEEDR